MDKVPGLGDFFPKGFAIKFPLQFFWLSFYQTQNPQVSHRYRIKVFVYTDAMDEADEYIIEVTIVKISSPSSLMRSIMTGG